MSGYDDWKTDVGDGWGVRFGRRWKPDTCAPVWKSVTPTDDPDVLLARLDKALRAVKDRDHHDESECDESCASCVDCNHATGRTTCRAVCPHAAALAREAAK